MIRRPGFVNGALWQAWASRFRRLDGALLKFVSVETHARTKQLFRIVVLSCVLMDTLLLLPVHSDLWGPNTLMPQFEPSGTPFTLLSRPSIAPYYQYFLFAQIIALVAAILGYYPRLMAIIAFFCTLNLHSGAEVILDGGNNLAVLMFTYLLFMNTSGDPHPRPNPTLFHSIKVGASNAAFFAARVQLAAVYLTAGLCKCLGPIWQSGTALYLILQHPRFGHPTLARLVVEHPMFTVVGTYFTIVFQLSFPCWIWVRRARPYLFAAGVCLHLGIAVLMGLFVFGAFMMVVYVVMFHEAWSVRVFEVAHAVATRLASRARQWLAGHGHSAENSPLVRGD